jgi:probable HAF family extracellular repeat protein
MSDLGTLGGTYSSANSISADGSVIIGYSNTSLGQTHAFRWTNNVMTDLGTLGGTNSFASSISADGSVIIGNSDTSFGQTHAFLWTNNVMTDLGTLGGTYSSANSISTDGSVIIGNSNTSSGQTHAFRWTDKTINGGIFGSYTGSNSTGGTICAKDCYTTGNIYGGGIFGSYTGSNSIIGTIYAENCYTMGNINSDSGGIFGSYTRSNSTGGTIYANNCYTTGTITTLNTGIYGINNNNGTVENCYITDGIENWNDVDANSYLITNFWTDINSNTSTPWLLSSFNNIIYNPNNNIIDYGTSSSSTIGLFQPDYTYSIISNSVSDISIDQTNGKLFFHNTLDANTYNINVLVGKKDLNENYYNYNINTYVLTVENSQTDYLSIIQQPISQTVAVGVNIFLSVIAESSSIITYKWYKNNIYIPNNNKSTLTLLNANSNYNASYYVEVSNNNTFMNSSNAIIKVLYPDKPLPPNIPNPINNTNYYQYTKLYNQLYNQQYNQLYNQLYNQQYNQLFIQLNNSINNNIIETNIQYCYIVDYTDLNNINITDYQLNNNNYNILYNKIYNVFYTPLYQELYNLLYIPLYNSIYQRLTKKPNNIIYNTSEVCTKITLDKKSEIYIMYIQIKNQLFEQLYSQLIEQLYNQLVKKI